MKIEVKNLSKRFGLSWVIKDFNFLFQEGSKTAINGPNGSGKSTLLRLLNGQLIPNQGDLIYTSNKRAELTHQNVSRFINTYGPYTELIEELTCIELAQIHSNLRPLQNSLSVNDLWERVGWTKKITKRPVAVLSSGMKQRLKLLLALGTESEAVFLDEPTSNLDDEGKLWYLNLVEDWLADRTLIVASNENADFQMCTEIIEQEQWFS